MIAESQTIPMPFNHARFSAVNLSGAQSYACYLVTNPTTGSNWTWQSIPSSSVPSIPTASNSTLIQGANEPILTRTLNMKDQKVYVTETDIRAATNRVNEINRKVTIK